MEHIKIEASVSSPTEASTIYTIYCHTHITSGRRYIGLTKNSWRQRWDQHISRSKYSQGNRSYFICAIRKYGKEAFSHEILEFCHTLDVANVAEQCWIEFYETCDRSKGFNIQKGGKHIFRPARNPWKQLEFREKCTSAIKASKSTPEAKANASKASKVMWQDPEFRQKVISNSKEARKHPEMFKKISKIMKEVASRPENKEKRSQTSSAMWKSEDYRTRNQELWKNKEFREKCTSGFTKWNNSNKSRTHCKYGHKFNENNTYMNPNGSRECRICMKRNRKNLYDSRKL